jgi:hypothetical protein
MRSYAHRRSVTLVLFACVGVAALLCASGCGGAAYDKEEDRKLSPDGAFRAIVGDTVRDSLGGDFGGDFKGVTIEKIYPTWKDTATLDRTAEICALQEDGELSIDWASPSHMIVTCWGCKKDFLDDVLDTWQGISIEYVFRDPRPDLKLAKR